MRKAIEAGLASNLSAKLVSELLDAHTEAKRNFYLGGLRLSEVEGGRFCEAAFRLLQQIVTSAFDPLGSPLDSEKVIRTLGNLPTGSYSDSIRLHIPRALRVVYDIRNKRDAAHLADGIDPNLQDATVVISVMDWVLAEFVRIYHDVSANEAQQIVESIVTRKAPSVQDFNGFLKMLRTDLQASDRCILLLYQRGPVGATFAQISEWSHPKARANLRRTINTLVDDRSLIHFDRDKYYITQLGQQYAERNKLTDPQL